MSGSADANMSDPFQDTTPILTTDVDPRKAAENQQKFNDAALGSNERTDPSEAAVNNASQPRKPVNTSSSSIYEVRRKIDWGSGNVGSSKDYVKDAQRQAAEGIPGTQTTITKTMNDQFIAEEASMYMTGQSQPSAQQMADAAAERMRDPLTLDIATQQRKNARQNLKNKQATLAEAIEKEDAYLIERYTKHVKELQLVYDTLTESYKRAGGRTYKKADKSKVKSDKSNQQRLPFTSLNDEIIAVGIQEVEPIREQPTTLASGPPGGNFPNTSQGQANYVPAENVGQNDLPVNYRIPTEEKYNIETEMSDVEFASRMNYIREKITTNGVEDLIVKVYGDINAYMDSIGNQVASGQNPDDLFNTEIQILNELELENLEYIGQEYQTTQEFDDMLKGLPSDDQQEIKNNISAVFDPSAPDASDLPLSGSDTGLYEQSAPMENKYNNHNVAPDDENDGYVNNPNMANVRRGRDTDVIQALNNIRKLSPHIANLLANESTRSLLIKPQQFKSIYPAPPKNTNLAVVQQSIARSQYDAALLNVYFN